MLALRHSKDEFVGIGEVIVSVYQMLIPDRTDYRERLELSIPHTFLPTQFLLILASKSGKVFCTQTIS